MCAFTPFSPPAPPLSLSMSDVSVQSALAAAQMTVTGLEGQLVEATKKRNTVMSKLREVYETKEDGFQKNFYTDELTYGGTDADIISAFKALAKLENQLEVFVTLAFHTHFYFIFPKHIHCGQGVGDAIPGIPFLGIAYGIPPGRA